MPKFIKRGFNKRETAVEDKFAFSNENPVPSWQGGFASPTPPSSERRGFFVKFFDWLSRASLYALIFLLPLFFFLPSSSLYLSKQFLAAILILLGTIALVGRVLLCGEAVPYLRAKSVWFLIIFTLGVGISAFFSGAAKASFWGLGGSQPFSGLSVLLLTVFFFLSLTLFADKNILRRSLVLFSLSSAILFVFSSLMALLVGLLRIKFLVAIFGTPAWNTFGSINSLAIFAAAGFSFALAILMKNGDLGRFFKAILYAQAISGLFLVLVVGYFYAYLLLALAMLALLAMLFIRYKKDAIKKFNIPLLVFICFLMLFIFQISFARFFSFPAEVSPTMSLSFDVGWKTMTSSVKNFVLGSGPSTFVYDYAKYRPEALNQTGFWDVRFTSGFAAAPTLLAEFGLLGIFFLVIFVLYKLVFFFTRLLKEEGEGDFYSGLFLAFLVMSASLFVYPLSFVSLFYLFFLSAVTFAIIALSRGAVEIFSFDTLAHKALMRALTLIAVLIGSIFLLFMSISHLLADIQFTKGLRLLAQGQGEQAAIKLASAANLYQNDAYSRNLALVAADNAIARLRKGDLTPDEARGIGNVFQAAINLSKQATELNPLERENWFALGAVYEKLIPYIDGAVKQAVESYGQVEKMEPNNPVIYLAQGRAYLSGAILARANVQALKKQQNPDQKVVEENEKNADGWFKEAKTKLELSLQKKNDLEAGYLILSQYYEQQSDLDKAIDNLQKARLINNQNPDSLLDLARLYFNQNKNDLAQTALENLLAVQPENRNALFLAGLVYDATGNSAKALETLEKLAKLDPSNQPVAQMVENLKAGRRANAAASESAEQPK